MESNVCACPFCGQYFLDGDPRERCLCGGAKEYRAKMAVQNKMNRAIMLLFGEDCGKNEPLWNPVEGEVCTFLVECAERICSLDSCERITVNLGDGSVCVMSYGKVVRKLNLKREATE